MYKVVRTALPLIFIAAVYSGGPFYDLFGRGTDWPTWGVLLLLVGIANILCACIDRAEGTRTDWRFGICPSSSA